MKPPASLPMQPKEWSSEKVQTSVMAESSAHTGLWAGETAQHFLKKKKKRYFIALLLTYKHNYNLLYYLPIVSF